MLQFINLTSEAHNTIICWGPHQNIVYKYYIRIIATYSTGSRVAAKPPLTFICSVSVSAEVTLRS